MIYLAHELFDINFILIMTHGGDDGSIHSTTPLFFLFPLTSLNSENE
jgi:hypothetical protein